MMFDLPESQPNVAYWYQNSHLVGFFSVITMCKLHWCLTSNAVLVQWLCMAATFENIDLLELISLFGISLSKESSNLLGVLCVTLRQDSRFLGCTVQRVLGTHSVINCISYGNFLQKTCSLELFCRITEGTKLWENLKVLEEHIGNLLRSFQTICSFRASPITTICRFYAVELVQGSLMMFDEASERSLVFGQYRRQVTGNGCLAS